MTEKFPSFGALFDTITFAIKDLASFGIAIFVMFLGFVYTAFLFYGTNDKDLASFGLTLLRLFYLQMGESDAFDLRKKSDYGYFNVLFFVLFMLIFSFLLLKMLVTIVIIRYKYLRSIVQLDNEANARIVKKKSEEANRKLLNFLL